MYFLVNNNLTIPAHDMTFRYLLKDVKICINSYVTLTIL